MAVTVYGADYSVYTRIVRLVLEEKRVEYELVPVDIFAEGGPPSDYLMRHPFGRIPAIEHDGFSCFETGAITRYVDDVFDGPRLQPIRAQHRARMDQLIGIADAYIYRALVWDIYVERVNKPERGEIPDEAKIAAALDKARIGVSTISDLMGEDPWLAGESLTLADLHLAPMIDYFLMTHEGRQTVGDFPTLMEWWARMERRGSMQATGYPT